MPRRRRIQLDGKPLHIVQRGHNREACFHGEEDCQSYLHWLGKVLGAANHLLSPHAVYRALGEKEKERCTAYRALFSAQLDDKAIADIRLALNQNQPLGNSRFYDRIERLSGVRREARPWGRPSLRGAAENGQTKVKPGRVAL